MPRFSWSQFAKSFQNRQSRASSKQDSVSSSLRSASHESQERRPITLVPAKHPEDVDFIFSMFDYEERKAAPLPAKDAKDVDFILSIFADEQQQCEGSENSSDGEKDQASNAVVESSEKVVGKKNKKNKKGTRAM